MTELTVSGLTASLAWYRDALGLTLTHLDEPGSFALLRAPEGGRLALKTGSPVPGSARLHFEVADLPAEIARLARAGVQPVTSTKSSEEGYRRVVFQDPDGHAVELFEWTRGREIT